MIGLTDRRRPWVAAASVAGCLYMMGWWNAGTARGAIGATGVTDQPDGTEVVLSLLRVEAIPAPGELVVGHAALHIPVRADTSARTVGEEITIGGVVQGGVVRAAWIETAPQRPLKHALGVVGLIVGAALWVASVRWTSSGFALRG